MMPILVQSDDVRSGRKAKARHGRLGPAWEYSLTRKGDPHPCPQSQIYKIHFHDNKAIYLLWSSSTPLCVNDHVSNFHGI